ncbi:MAG: M48 family metallopeptidase [Deltaproteobacteria bacterium]|nr:M48 family metallopeptidase [Deltaproteobacteria bacterium]
MKRRSEKHRIGAGRANTLAVKALGAVSILTLLAAGCVVEPVSAPRRGPSYETRRPVSARESRSVDPRTADRLQRIMIPLLRARNNPRGANEVRIGIVRDSSINAANAGGGVFYLTTGLLERASDDQLRGVLAHEIAHDDLGHVAKAKVLGAGLNLGVVLLERLIPGSSAVSPIAGTLIARGYSRSEEYAADRHGVEILRRAGYPGRDVMINALTWVSRASEARGGGGGGFLSTHPATSERIDALRRLG